MMCGGDLPTLEKSMIYRARTLPADSLPHAADAPAPRLPAGFALGGQLTNQFQAFLAANGIGQWKISFSASLDFGDVEHHLNAIHEQDAAWTDHPTLPLGGAQPMAIAPDMAWKKGMLLPAGFLWLKQHQAVLARWHYYDFPHQTWIPLYLIASPSAAEPVKLRKELNRIQRRRARNAWRVFSAEQWGSELIDRGSAQAWEKLVLDPAVRHRLATEVTGFFRKPVARLYRDLKLPYRRGVLLHGSPGNGKTSLVRAIGALNPGIPGLLLRPGENFADSQFASVIDAWCDQAPAILVIEDLDWLFHAGRVNVSTFLNMLDGVDRRDGGLLLIATTNHPESLDPAINNRPGRFDVAVEIRSPEAPLRREYFNRSGLTLKSTEAMEKLVSSTDGLSFAHLREIESLSGLQALQAGRAAREEQDILAAADIVKRRSEDARQGFPEPTTPFGLAPTRGGREESIPY
jgi:hypothetical protein